MESASCFPSTTFSIWATMPVRLTAHVRLTWYMSLPARLSSVFSSVVAIWSSSVATPLALLVLGIQFEFSAVSELKKEIIFGVLIRTVVVPILGLGVAYVFFNDYFTGAHFATFVAVFATPVAVSSVPMVQEMDGDVTLAGQLVIWTTVISALTVFLASFLLKNAGIF